MRIFGGDDGTTSRRRQLATISKVGATLSERENVQGFSDEIGRAILEICCFLFAFEKPNVELGRNEPVRRVAPALYGPGWICLTRLHTCDMFLKMIVAMLADQKAIMCNES